MVEILNGTESLDHGHCSGSCVHPCVSVYHVSTSIRPQPKTWTLHSSQTVYLISNQGHHQTPTNLSKSPIISCHRRLGRVTLQPQACRLQPGLNSSETLCLQQELPPLLCHIINPSVWQARVTAQDVETSTKTERNNTRSSSDSPLQSNTHKKPRKKTEKASGEEYACQYR